MRFALSKPEQIATLRKADEVAGYRYGREMLRRAWMPGEHEALIRRTAAVGADAVQVAWDRLCAAHGAP